MNRLPVTCVLRAIAAAVLSLLAIPAISLEGGEPQPSAVQPAGAAAGRDSWLNRQIKRFRSYPHLDRAYQLLREGKAAPSASEFSQYLLVEPEDSAVRSTYLTLLYQMGDFARTVIEADWLVRNRAASERVLLYRALSNQHLQRTAAAVSDFSKVAESDTATSADRLFAANSLVGILIAAGDSRGARAGLKLVARYSDDFAVHFRTGVVDESLEDFSAAEAEYRISIERATNETESIEALGAAARLALRRKQWDDASMWLGRAQALEPNNLELLHGLAQAAMGARHYPEAEKWTEAALAIEPSHRDHEILANLAAARRGWSHAIDLYLMALADADTAQDHYRTLDNLMNAYLALGMNARAEATLHTMIAIRENPTNLRKLAILLETEGKTADAARVLERLMVLGPDADDHSHLSVLYEKLRQHEAAITQIELALRQDDRADLHLRLGYLLADSGNYAIAARELRKGAGPEKPALLHVYLADLYGKAGDEPSRFTQLDLALAANPAPALRQQIQQQRGYILVKRGNDEAGIGAFRAAMSAGLDDDRIHMDLAFALLRLRRWESARDEFLLANERHGSTLALYYAARCYHELDQQSLWLNYLRIAQRGANELEPDVRKVFLNELGLAEASQGDAQAASTAWQSSLALHYDPAIALQLAVAQQRTGHTLEAEATLSNIPAGSLTTAQQSERSEVLAAVAEQNLHLTVARKALAEADELRPTAARAYRMGVLAQRSELNDTAIGDFQRAAARDPSNPLYLESLAYAYKRTGETSRAIDFFERAIERNPGHVALYRDLAYTQMSVGLTNEAAQNLRTAIDLQMVNNSNNEANNEARSDADSYLAHMREEYTGLTRSLSALLYESYRPGRDRRGRDTTAANAANGGLIPSQAGMDVSYGPKGLFGRSDDPLQIDARLFWNNPPGGLGVDHASLQAGLAVRYKPFQSRQFFLAAERLFRVGGDSRNDWLLRASFGFGHEVQPQRSQALANYSQLYVDAGYFTQSRVKAVYAQLNQGISIRTSDRSAITPHVVLVERHQSPDPTRTSVLEGGPGVSFKYSFGPAHYSATWGGIDLVLQYRARITGEGRSDWVFSTVFEF